MQTVDQDRAAEVLGIAIKEAVRRAVQDVGLSRTTDADPTAAAATTTTAGHVGDDVIDLTDGTNAAPGSGPLEMLDPYEVLGVPPRSSWDEIVAARNRRLREWHPDAGGDEELLITLNAAYAELRIRRGR